MQLYVHLNGATRGPLSEERVQALLAEGLLLGSDLAAENPDGEWRSLETFRRFSTAPQAVPLSMPTVPAVLPETQPAAPAAVPAPDTATKGGSLVPLNLSELGPYARSTIAPDEKAYFRTSLHWVIFVRFAILALLVFLFIGMPFAIGVQALTGSQLGWFALPLPAFIMLPPTLAFASSELVITDKRLLIKTGIVSRQSLELFISRIESVGVDQGVVGRMFDYGTVKIRGMGGSEQAFEAIADPLQFRSAVQRLQSGTAHPGR
ncbi:MAG: PH domain-containing protein [Chthoniobacterales bacterium]|nr:PH domain-containing protein [Chthoniobacterales bacterium]